AGKKLFPRWRGPEAQASRAITKAYRGLSKPRLLDESVKMRAVGNAALADVLEQESGATDLQKAKATVRRIERGEGGGEDPLEEVRRGGPGTPPPTTRPPSTRGVSPKGFGKGGEQGIEETERGREILRRRHRAPEE